jgi:hypothetical protein
VGDDFANSLIAMGLLKVEEEDEEEDDSEERRDDVISSIINISDSTVLGLPVHNC